MPAPLNSHDDLVHTGKGARLDSWKEIAAHLGRSERTVKRWEAERGLPVYRVPGGGRGSVYAFAAELDEWLISSPGPSADSSAEFDHQGVDLPEAGGKDQPASAHPPDSADFATGTSQGTASAFSASEQESTSSFEPDRAATTPVAAAHRPHHILSWGLT
jgi:hypothetical protein